MAKSTCKQPLRPMRGPNGQLVVNPPEPEPPDPPDVSYEGQSAGSVDYDGTPVTRGGLIIQGPSTRPCLQVASAGEPPIAQRRAQVTTVTDGEAGLPGLAASSRLRMKPGPMNLLPNWPPLPNPRPRRLSKHGCHTSMSNELKTTRKLRMSRVVQLSNCSLGRKRMFTQHLLRPSMLGIAITTSSQCLHNRARMPAAIQMPAIHPHTPNTMPYKLRPHISTHIASRADYLL
jgi:hypothetical protein